MNDLISRQAAISIPIMPKEHREYQTFNLDDAYDKGWMDCQACISLIPQEQQWIHVSERLPEPRHAVLVWCPERKNPYCAYTLDGKWLIYGSHRVVLEEAVEAWMYVPLPEPYKDEKGQRQ